MEEQMKDNALVGVTVQHQPRVMDDPDVDRFVS